MGALALGFIYQFYYNGGDTYNFHTHGSRHVWEAFWDSPASGIKLLFSNGEDQIGIYKYSSKIPFFGDPSSYMVIRIASILDLITFSAYSATAVCFGAMSFVGGWMLFLTFYEDHRHLAGWIAMATLFIPSVFFWGSGLLKDTITLTFLGVATYFIWKIVAKKEFKITYVICLILSLFIIYSIKKYILLSYLPAVLLMISARAFTHIKNVVVKIVTFPFMAFMVGACLYVVVDQVGKDDVRYDLQQLGNTAKITAYDIAFQTGRDAGSPYFLGELDGTFTSLIRLAPEAVNVSLYRPYLWEVNNPLMLMSALESLAFLLLTIFVIIKSRFGLFNSLASPDILFCFVFSIIFAFAVGVSTYNFGTLSRYKIPLMPFYLLTLIFIYDQAKRERNLDSLDRTE
ncbi:MAG: hypothetical protein WD824_06380 [Cyclobacteriaceae bacterium]